VSDLSTPPLSFFASLKEKLGIQRYGLKVGRLWIRGDFVPRELWIGVRVKETYLEMGEKHQVIYVCLIPSLRILLDWTRRS
jgi:hypothetical protein